MFVMKIEIDDSKLVETVVKEVLFTGREKGIFKINHNCLILCLLCRYHFFYM